MGKGGRQPDGVHWGSDPSWGARLRPGDLFRANKPGSTTRICRRRRSDKLARTCGRGSIVWRGARRPSGPVLRAQERKRDKLRGRRDAFSGAFLRASVDCPVARSHVRRRRALPGEFPPTVACLAPLRRVCVEPLSVQLQSFLSPDRFFVMILELLLSFREFFPFVASGARIFFSEGARI